MALPASGPLSIQQINAEFGRGNNLNSYRGTTWYTDAGGSGTFSTGALSMSDFYGKRATSPSFSFSISQHIDQANLRSLAVAAGWNGSSPVVATLTGGYYLYSTTTQAALTIDGSWPGGVTFVNNGYVMGMGGHGGGYSYDGANSPVYIGNWGLGAGGPAISLGVSCTIQNNTYIGGGGGGGGATQGLNASCNAAGAGGGGAGGGVGGDIRAGTTLYYYGGAGGGLGGGGSNGQTTQGYYYGGGGGGGRIMPGSRVNGPNVTNNGGYGYAGYGAEATVTGGNGSYAGSPTVAYNSTGSGGYGGSAGGSGSAGAGYPYGTSMGGGGGGGGWGASGGTGTGVYAYYGSVITSGAGAAGGKCVHLNGYLVTWSATGNRYGGIS
jgi:hypothetical protein